MPTPTPAPETINLTGQKTWIDNDNADRIRPDTIAINLFADGAPIARIQVRASHNWTWTVHNLKKYNDRGQEIRYTITEDTVAGYTAVIDGLNVTNIRTPDNSSLRIIKVWDDMNDLDGSRPASVNVTLTANGKPLETFVLSEENSWTASVNDLPASENGVPIIYAWQEETIAGYSSEMNTTGTLTVLTNRHTPELTEASVRKEWADDDNKLGMRPASLTVTLSNGTSVILNPANNWSATVTGLPKARQGVPIVYTWSEQVPAGYTQESVQEANGVTVITNRIWERPAPPDDTPYRYPGKPTEEIDDYETPLGVEVTINHVGHCFD